MLGMDILMAADRLVGKLMTSIAGDKKADATKEAEEEKRLSAYARNNKRDEYLVKHIYHIIFLMKIILIH